MGLPRRQPFPARMLQLLLASTAYVVAQEYGDQVVVCLTPADEAAARAIRELESSNDMNFWSEPGLPGSRTDIMLSRDRAGELLPRLALLGVEGRICIEDLQALVDAERRPLSSRFSRSQAQAFHAEYHTGEELLQYFVGTVVPAHSNTASTFSIGTTHEGRDLRVIRVTGGAKATEGGLPSPNGLPAVWAQSLIHAREHLAGASLAYAVDEILTQYGVETWATNLGGRRAEVREGGDHLKGGRVGIT